MGRAPLRWFALLCYNRHADKNLGRCITDALDFRAD